MDIGAPEKQITVEPVEEPVPAPVPEETPEKVEEPEKVEVGVV